MNRFATSLVVLSTLIVQQAAAPAFAGPFPNIAVIDDSELASQRAGFVLPNGLAIDIGIAIDTIVDGQLALRSVVWNDGSLHVFGAGADAAGAPVAPSLPVSSAPRLGIDGTGAGMTVTPAPVAVLPIVRVGTGQGEGTAAPAGPELVLMAGGPSVPDAFGSVRLEQTDGGAAVVLVGPTLEVRHLIGAATGVVVANTADNRSIDTVATINVNIRDALPLGVSDALHLDVIAARALAMRTPF